ncbi:MAG: hypothetical protein RIM99_19360 [Cyclobacteriaceae bacterium]
MLKIFTFIAVLFFVLSGLSQEKTSWGTINYPVDVESMETGDLSFLNSDLENYNYFCTSEFHRSELAIAQYKKFIKYLIENKGLDKLVMERPYAYGYLITKYLQSGDTILLRAATDEFWSFDKFKMEDEVSHDAFSLFSWLYQYLQERNETIEVVGIDVNQSLHGTIELYTLLSLVDSYDISDFFPKTYQQLQELENLDKPALGKLKSWLYDFKEEFKSGERDIKEKLEKDFTHFQQTIIAIDDLLIYGNGSRKGKKHREETMVRNFKNQVAPEDVIYAQFGAGHIAIGELPNFSGFMAMLQKEDDYANRTLSISIHCIKCQLGESTTAFKPYILFEDGSGYWWSDSAYTLNEAGEEKKMLIDQLNQTDMAIDFRDATKPFDYVKNRFQYVIILF